MAQRGRFVPSTLLALALVLASLAPHALGNSIPPGGCIHDKCVKLADLKHPTSVVADPLVGFYYGRFNRNPLYKGNSTAWSGKRGGPAVNYEVFPRIESEYLINSAEATGVTSLSECCSMCARTEHCTIFQFFESGNISEIPINYSPYHAVFKPQNFVDGQQCYLLTGGTNKADGGNGAPSSGKYSQQISSNRSAVPNRLYAPSFVGGYCNPEVRDDPHFTGAMGTRFDFNGEIGKTFNLISDENVHINIKLGGYLDTNTFGATALKSGQAIRTWIKEVGFIWGVEGVRHTAVLVARPGKQQERGQGFMSHVLLDGVRMSAPGEGKPIEAPGFALACGGVEKKGPYDLETFFVDIGEVFGGKLVMRPAHPLLQTPEDAQVHFNLQILKLQATPRVHGVLGQTFRSTSGQQMKALEFRVLNNLIGGPVVADGESGEGFLEGSVQDYVTSSITSTDSTFSVQ